MILYDFRVCVVHCIDYKVLKPVSKNEHKWNESCLLYLSTADDTIYSLHTKLGSENLYTLQHE